MSISYTEFYNENEGRAYPLAEQATRLSNAQVKLPDDLMVDLSLMVPTTHTGIYVSSVNLTAGLISIGIASTTSGILIGTYERAAIVAYRALPLSALVDGVSGWIVFGPNLLQSTDYGYYRFSSAIQSGVEERVIHHIQPTGVMRFLSYTGRPGEAATGVVRFIGNSNFKIAESPTLPGEGLQIALDPAVAQVMAGPCIDAASKDTCGTPPIRTINGVSPDITGKITIRFE